MYIKVFAQLEKCDLYEVVLSRKKLHFAKEKYVGIHGKYYKSTK